MDGDLRWIREKIEGWFEVKVRAVMGPEDGDDKEATLLNRTIRWTSEGVEFEADGKHRDRVLDFFGLNDEDSGFDRE